MSVRRAAEALFRSQARQPEQEVSSASLSAEQSVRKPRILPVIKPAPVRVEKTVTPVADESPKALSIPAVHVARIRTWLMYGMTIRQVAQVYGVGIGVIQRLL